MAVRNMEKNVKTAVKALARAGHHGIVRPISSGECVS